MNIVFAEPSEEVKRLQEAFRQQVKKVTTETLENGGTIVYMDEEGWLVHESKEKGNVRIKNLKKKNIFEKILDKLKK